MNNQKVTLFWHRRDLRIADNAGLFKALQSSSRVLPLFIFDTTILDQLPRNDARVSFIHQELQRVKRVYETHGSTLIVKHGKPLEVWANLLRSYAIEAVYTNRDYEPYALSRDQSVFELLKTHGIPFKGSKDHVIFEKSEVTKDDGKPYTVFTPYMKKWRLTLPADAFDAYESEHLLNRLFPCAPSDMPTLNDLGFEAVDIDYPAAEIKEPVLEHYAERRDLPAVAGTTRLSIHLRFGTISIRAAARAGAKISEKWLNELIWRDFYQMILHHFPHSVNAAFKPMYDLIPWRTSETDFIKWCEGKTGYPLVDAGMRELNATGFMHNRVRMVTASFLTKHLLLDWRLGERYFAEKLLDFELASNVGGWQWAAGSGCDAAPYFRVFNPAAQQAKFDPNFVYIKRWVPEYGSVSYPAPMVDHAMARKRAIDTYKAALS